MVFDWTDERHPTLFKRVTFYIWPTRWAKPSEELALFIRRKGGKCYDWHSSDSKHDELVARAKAPAIVLVDPTEKDSLELLSKREEGGLQFVSWAYPQLCFQSGEAVNLNKAAKRLLFVRMCDGTPYSFFFDCDRTKSREVRQMGELKIQFTNHGGKVVEDLQDADAIITAKKGDALQDLQIQYSFTTYIRVETFDWLKDCLSHSSWRFSPPSRQPLSGRRPGQKMPFTAEEDTLLVKYLAERTRRHEGRQGQTLFKNLITLGEIDASYSWVKRHTWQSWRNHYIKAPRKEQFDNWILQYQNEHPPPQTDGYGTYPYTRDMNRRNRIARVSARSRKQLERDENEEEEAEVEEEIDELESDWDSERLQTDQTDGKGDDREFESERERGGQSRQRQHLRDLSVPIDVRQETELNYEDDGDDVYSKQDGQRFVSEEQPIPRPQPLAKAKRQRGAVDDAKSGEDDEDDEGQRQRKRRKTEYTQTTLVNTTQYNPIRDSPLRRAAASKHAPSQDFLTPTRLPGLSFTKHTERAPVPHMRVMDFTAGRAKRRDSVAQQIADQTFAVEHEEDGEEEADIHSREESSHPSGRHQEEDFGEVTELRTPKRQRKSRLDPDSIPAMTYQTVRTGARTRSQSRAETPLGDAYVNTRTSTHKTGRISSRRKGNMRH